MIGKLLIIFLFVQLLVYATEGKGGDMKNVSNSEVTGSISKSDTNVETPRSKITFPRKESKVVNELVLISGTAASDGAEICEVMIEILDLTDYLHFNGKSWQPDKVEVKAEGTTEWQFSFKVGKPGHEYKITSKAVDTKGRKETEGDSVTFKLHSKKK